jgi:hypothetical protein
MLTVTDRAKGQQMTLPDFLQNHKDKYIHEFNTLDNSERATLIDEFLRDKVTNKGNCKLSNRSVNKLVQAKLVVISGLVCFVRYFFFLS